MNYLNLIAFIIIEFYAHVDTMMKFASFETIVEMIYKYAIPTPKDQCSKQLQLGVSFAGGYVAGVFCAIVSHPADNLVSFLNNAKGATVGDVSAFLDLYLEKSLFVFLFLLLFFFKILFSAFLLLLHLSGFAGCEEDGFMGSVH